MAPISRTLFRTAILSFSVITLCALTFFYEEKGAPFRVKDRGFGFSQQLLSSARFGTPVHGKPTTERLDLTDHQCKEFFPGLTKDVDDAVRRGKFVFEKSNPEYKGLVQGRIKDGKLYVLTAAPDITTEVLQQRTAILHQLHRALLTSPDLLPNTYFAFVINDSPKNNSWAFAHPNKASTYNTWLMPHFGFWGWPSPTLGTFDDVLERITEVEDGSEWEQKIDKLAWRGTPWFNPLGHPTLRQDLIKATAGKEWADVQALNETSSEEKKGNALKIEDFCKHKYIVYTEGVTYSGRLPYHQACASVLLTPPLTYLTHTAQFIKPILAEDLMTLFGVGIDQKRDIHVPADNGPPPKTPPALLPTVKDYREANAIYISPEFLNLESVIQFLRAHLHVAEQLASNQRDTVIGSGLLSRAAETCYWRALVKGWASVAVAKEEDWEELGDGERFETWILKQVTERRENVRGKSGRCT